MEGKDELAESVQIRLSAAQELCTGDVIRVEGPGGWSNVPGNVIVKTVTPKKDEHGEIFDVILTVKRSNRQQDLPSPCSGGSYFSASKCSVQVIKKKPAARAEGITSPDDNSSAPSALAASECNESSNVPSALSASECAEITDEAASIALDSSATLTSTESTLVVSSEPSRCSDEDGASGATTATVGEAETLTTEGFPEMTELEVVVTSENGDIVEAKAWKVMLGSSIDGFNTPGFRISHPEGLQNKTFEEGDPACVLKLIPNSDGSGPDRAVELETGAPAAEGAVPGAGGGTPAMGTVPGDLGAMEMPEVVVTAVATNVPSPAGTPGTDMTAESFREVLFDHVREHLEAELEKLPNFHNGLGAPNMTTAKNPETWLKGISKRAGDHHFYVESLNGHKAIPYKQHPTVTTSTSQASAIESDALDPRTFLDLTNFTLSSFGDDTSRIQLRVFLVEGLFENRCFEKRSSEDPKPRGICSDYRSDGVRMGEMRYLNDGTAGLVLAVFLVENSKQTPFTYLVLFWDMDAKAVCLVSTTSIMRLVNEQSKMDVPSSQLELPSTETCLQAIAAAARFCKDNTKKDNRSVFYCKPTDTLWRGAVNRLLGLQFNWTPRTSIEGSH